MALDLLLRGGMLVDPYQGIGAIRDIGVRDGRIAVVAEAVSEEATTTLNVAGKVVTPGLIDLHGSEEWCISKSIADDCKICIPSVIPCVTHITEGNTASTAGGDHRESCTYNVGRWGNHHRFTPRTPFVH